MYRVSGGYGRESILLQPLPHKTRGLGCGGVVRAAGLIAQETYPRPLLGHRRRSREGQMRNVTGGGPLTGRMKTYSTSYCTS